MVQQLGPTVDHYPVWLVTVTVMVVIRVAIRVCKIQVQPRELEAVARALKVEKLPGANGIPILR